MALPQSRDLAADADHLAPPPSPCCADQQYGLVGDRSVEIRCLIRGHLVGVRSGYLSHWFTRFPRELTGRRGTTVGMCRGCHHSFLSMPQTHHASNKAMDRLHKRQHSANISSKANTRSMADTLSVPDNCLSPHTPPASSTPRSSRNSPLAPRVRRALFLQVRGDSPLPAATTQAASQSGHS